MTEKLDHIEDLIRDQHLEEAEQVLGVEPPPAGEESIERLYLRAYLAERRHDWEQCIDCYEQVLLRDEEHTATLFRLAYVLDLLGEDERALQLYERCTIEAPAHINALMNMAVLYEDHGNYEAALRCLNAVLEQHPNHARARLFRDDVEASRTMYYDEDQERLRDQHDAVLDTPISEFELSVRSRNCLKQMNINTLGDLLNTTEVELLSYKNFGETSLNEIKLMLVQKGLVLGQERQPSPQDLLASAVIPPTSPPVGDPTVLQRSVNELQLSVRARKCLQRLGITTISELITRTEPELLSTKNFGHVSLVELRQQLTEMGLALRSSK